jgi:branched-chain amino acid transport system permease protein
MLRRSLLVLIAPPDGPGGVLVRRRVAVFLATLMSLLVCVLGVGAGTANAEGESIFGFLRNPKGKELVPVEGAKITVKGPGVNETVTSDETGRWTVEVNKDGTFTVTLDQKSLPKGVTLRNPDADTLKVPVAVGQDKPVLFALGKSTRQVQSKWSQAAQLTAEGFRFGLIIALAAVGLSLIFGTTGLTNFSHGELVTIGAIFAWWLSSGNLPLFFPDYGGMNFFLAAALTLVLMGVVGWANDAGLWRPLRRRGTGLIAAMIVSIGLAILLRYFLLYLFSGTTRSYETTRGQRGLGIGPITLSPADYISMAVAIVVLLVVAFALLRTRLGKATRAVADNPALAAASGIDVDGVIRLVWIAGAMLAGLAGILLGIAQGVNFQLGFQILLLMFAAVTLGGLGTAFGALVGSIVVGLFVTVSTLVIPTELKSVGALGILIVILLVRPQGILGRAQRVG